MNFDYKLAVGPMSEHVIKAVFELSQEKKEPLMLIASKNQIDWSGGYVNNWNTYDYMDYLREMKLLYKDANVLICRDHCGPGFKKLKSKIDPIEDVYKTIEADLKAGFDLIHLDFCHLEGTIQEKIDQTKKAIDYAKRLNPEIFFEVGTDENTATDFKSIENVEKEIEIFSSYENVLFYVIQTGSLVKEINQAGFFHEEYVNKIRELANKNNIKIKEHNADYLSRKELFRREKLIDAVNIAPCLGVVQTFLTLERCMMYGINIDIFLEDCYQSKKWEKWLQGSRDTNRFLCSVIAGHYNFHKESYKNIFNELMKIEEFDKILVESLKKSIINYLI